MNQPPTVEEFRAAKPQFAAVETATVEIYLELGVEAVPQLFTPVLYKHAVIAFTCHLMTLEGLGSDAQSLMFHNNYQNMQTVKSGVVTLTQFRKEAEGQFTFSGWLNQTQCGATYYTWLKAAAGGPRVAMGGIDNRVSYYARDFVFAGWV